MPPVQGLDGSPLHQTNGWLPPPTLPVCERAQVLDRGAHSPWPFLYSYRQDGSVINNRGSTQTPYESAQEVGAAIF